MSSGDSWGFEIFLRRKIPGTGIVAEGRKADREVVLDEGARKGTGRMVVEHCMREAIESH
jgi:hypothetical protein